MLETLAHQLISYFSRYKLRFYKKRETILRPDEAITGICYLKQGYIRQYSISKEGQELTLNIFKPQSLIFMLLALNGSLNNYYYEALTPVELYHAPLAETLKFLHQEPAILVDVLHRVGKGLGGFFARMESLTFGTAQTKLATTLLILAKRFGEKKNGMVTINLPLTHNDLANLVGMTRETTSLELKKLEKKGLIARNKKLTLIKDFAAIEEMSSVIPE